MFIVHVHCSLFMFIVHCSHGATLIFDDVFLSKLMTNNLEMLGRTFILDTSEDARIMDDYTGVFLQLLRVGRPNNLKARNKSGAIACKGHKKCAIKILLYNTDRSNDNLNI